MPSRTRSGDEPPEVIIALTRLGRIVRVSAIDSTPLVEVVVQGPAAAGEAALRAAALKKLAYALRRRTMPRRH